VKFFAGRKVFIPDTTWANHRDIFVAAGAEVRFRPIGPSAHLSHRRLKELQTKSKPK
jgi:aspartate/tyrosine/aromatic aminotransferase